MEISNRKLTKIFETMRNASCTDWSKKLDEALWAYRTTFENLIGMSPCRMVLGKACHLSVELEHKAYWAAHMLNFEMKSVRKHIILQLNERDEFRLGTYENVKLYKEKTKRWHDRYIKRIEFEVG